MGVNVLLLSSRCVSDCRGAANGQRQTRQPEDHRDPLRRSGQAGWTGPPDRTGTPRSAVLQAGFIGLNE